MKFLLLTVALVHCAFASQAEKGSPNDDTDEKQVGGNSFATETLLMSEDLREHLDALKSEPNPMQQGGEQLGLEFCEKCNAERDANPAYPLCPDCKVREDEEQKVQFAESGGLDTCTTDYEDLRLFSSEPCETCQAQLDQKPTWKRVSQENKVKQITEGDKAAGDIEINKISKVSTPILGLIVEYLKHHDGKVPAEIAKPIRSVQMEKIVADEWDAQFINKQTKKVIFQIILGANYMNIRSLLHLGCAKIATMIKGKSPEEIKKILGDDEEAKVDTRRRLAELSDAFSKFN